MYDADYAEFRHEQQNRYSTLDSGSMAQHADGVVRDTQEGKTKFTLMFPKGVAMEDQLIVRVAELYTRGGEKYGDRNWEKSNSEETLEHHLEALWRHFMKFCFGVQDGEDHAAAIVWNVNAIDLTRRKIYDEAFRDYTAVSQEIAAPGKNVTLHDCDNDVWTLNRGDGLWYIEDDNDGLTFEELLKEWGPLTTGGLHEPG